jgi:hypothetical protein
MHNKTVWLALSALIAGCSVSGDWRNASRDSAGIAPDPFDHPEAVVQVYGADAWGWRGWFAIHTWIAVKRSGEPSYTVYDVVGWRKRWRDSVVAATEDVPDRRWFGAQPQLILDRRGEGVDALIDRIESAVEQYPWPDEYTAFPGPNSNTFVAWVGHRVPELELDLPFSAIGSGYVSRVEPGEPVESDS